MNTVTPAILNLSRHLMAFEAARNLPNDLVGPTVRVCEKLRSPLAKLVGVAGFRSLMTRAKAIATAEVPWLESVQIRADGSLEGFDAASLHRDGISGSEAGVVVMAHLLGLLVTFIGEPLTQRLVQDAWPNASLAETDPGSAERL